MSSFRMALRPPIILGKGKALLLSFIFMMVLATNLPAQENREWGKAMDAFWEYYEKGKQAALLKQAQKIRTLAARLYPLPHRRSYFADHCLATALLENGRKEEADSIWLSLYQILQGKTDTSYDITKYSVYESLLLEVFLEDSTRYDSAALVAADYLKYAKMISEATDYYEEAFDVALQLEEKIGIEAARPFYREAIAMKGSLGDPNQSIFALFMLDALDKYCSLPGFFQSYFASLQKTDLTISQINEAIQRFRSDFSSDSILYFSIWKADAYIAREGPHSDSFYMAAKDLVDIIASYESVNRSALTEHVISHQLERLMATGRTGTMLFAHTLYNLAECLPENRAPEAINHFQNALRWYETIAGSTDSRVSTLQAIAFRYHTLQMNDSAFQYMSSSLALSAKTNPENSLQFLLHKKSYGYLCLNSGRLDDALKTFLEVYGTYTKTYGIPKGDKLVYDLSEAIASTYGYKNQPAKEIEWFEKCNDWLKQNNASISDQLYNLNRLFFAYLGMGDLKTAKTYLEQQEKLTGDNTTTFDKGLLTHAKFEYYFRKNDYKATLEYIPDLINGDLANYESEKDWVMYTNLTNTYEQVAEVYYKLRQPDSIYRIISEITSLARERNSTPQTSKLAAQYHFLKGNRDSALYYFSKDLVTGTNDQNYAKATQKNRLGMAYWHFNDLQKADSLLTLSIGEIMSFVVDNFSGLSEKERRMYTGRLKEYLHKYHNFLLHFPGNKSSNTTAFELIQQSKGLLLQSSALVQKDIREYGSDEAKQTFASLTEARKKLAKFYQLPDAPVDSLQAVVSLLERKLSTQSSSFQNYLKSTETRFTDIRDQLKANEAIIEFVSYPWLDGEEFKDSVLLTAYVIRKDSTEPVQVNLGGDQIVRSFVAMQHSLQTARGGTSSRVPGSFSLDTVVKKLYQQIWKPLEPVLAGIETIFISPDGILNKLSFASMKDAEGKYLSDRFAFRYVLSGKEIVNNNSRKDIANRSVMLFGAADFDMGIDKNAVERKGISERSDRANWQYLPGTLTEVQLIDSLAKTNNWEASPYLAARATEAMFKQEIQKLSPSILHVATHGFYFPADAITGSNNYFQRTEDPLARCGIIFSGANLAWMGGSMAGEEDDGILTGLELANLDLSNIELMVLSACETGIGEIVDGEGVYGLQRALKQAGVKNMLLSLWPVPDKETSEMMKEFYKQLMNGQALPIAFRLAQTFMKDKYQGQPGLWGAFVLIE